jgi:hypothetical protein
MESDGGTRQRNCTPGIDEEGITETPELGPYEMKRRRTIHENEKILEALNITSAITSAAERRLPGQAVKRRLMPEEPTHPKSRSIAPEQHREHPRTRSATAAAASGAAAHQEQQRSSSSSASGAASAAAERQTRVEKHARATRHSFFVGQNVWARDSQHGNAWWPASVTAVRPVLRVTWENPQHCDPIFSPADTHDVRMRLLCKCGSCTAEMLADDRALQEHEVRVNACISHKTLQGGIEEIRKNTYR